MDSKGVCGKVPICLIHSGTILHYRSFLRGFLILQSEEKTLRKDYVVEKEETCKKGVAVLGVQIVEINLEDSYIEGPALFVVAKGNDSTVSEKDVVDEINC